MHDTDDLSLPSGDVLRLDQFLKLNSIAGTGGQAKLLIQGGEVMVNGETETRRRRKLVSGDRVQWGESVWIVGSAGLRE